MSGEENGNKVDLHVGLSARASLETKISTEIPSQSSGRLVDAITDWFRPFTERRGLRADLIRLQREDVLFEIAQKARRRLEIDQVAPSPLPTKFLIPFLEKASLEDGDNFLIDRWADLLVSSSTQPESAHPRFVQILSEIGAAEAKLLRNIALHKADNVRDLHLDSNLSYFPDNFRRVFSGIRLATDTPALRCKELSCKIMCLIAGPGTSVTDLSVLAPQVNSAYLAGCDMPSDRHPANFGQANNKLYVDLLCSLHLLSQYNVEVARPEFARIHVSYVVLTPLGVEFLQKCDRHIRQRVLNPLKPVNHICDDAEFCPKQHDPEWGQRGYKWWIAPKGASGAVGAGLGACCPQPLDE